MYYFNVVGAIIYLGALAFVNTIVIESTIKSDDSTPFFLVSAVSLLLMLPVISVTKMIHLRANLNDKFIEYGSVFFYQEASYDQLKSIKKVWYAYHVYKLRIWDSNHFVQASPKSMKSLKEELGFSL